MKYSKIKNIVISIVPVVFFYLYSIIQNNLRLRSARNFQILPYLLFNILAPIFIGIILFLIISYIYTNRNSLIFIFLFIGSVFVNILYALYLNGMMGFRRVSLDMSAASQIAYVISGTYIIGFWISLISFIKGRKNANNTESIT